MVCVVVYVFGLVLMLGTDAQKYFVLRERPGLISHGYFAYSRNTNYLGEMILYSSFGILVQSNLVWCYYISFWTFVFSLRML